jgi:hypothetical protein
MQGYFRSRGRPKKVKKLIKINLNRAVDFYLNRNSQIAYPYINHRPLNLKNY